MAPLSCSRWAGRVTPRVRYCVACLRGARLANTRSSSGMATSSIPRILLTALLERSLKESSNGRAVLLALLPRNDTPFKTSRTLGCRRGYRIGSGSDHPCSCLPTVGQCCGKWSSLPLPCLTSVLQGNMDEVVSWKGYGLILQLPRSTWSYSAFRSSCTDRSKSLLKSETALETE